MCLLSLSDPRKRQQDKSICQVRPYVPGRPIAKGSDVRRTTSIPSTPKVIKRRDVQAGFIQTYAVAQRTEDGLAIKLIRSADIYSLQVELSQKSIERAVAANPEFDVDVVSYELARYDPATVTLTTFPLQLSSNSRHFLKPKYRQIRSIAFEGIGNIFDGNGDISLEFADMPAGFVRDMFAGFGLNHEYRFIVEQLERTTGAKAMVLSEYFHSRMKDGVAHLTYDTFDTWRRALRRSHNEAVAFANRAKSAYLRGKIEKEFDAQAGEQTQSPAPADLADGLAKALNLPGRRRALGTAAAAVAAVREGSSKLGTSDRAELLELNREIELLTLEQLIARLEGHLEHNHPEAFWQKFLSENPFILRLAFGLPIAVFGDQVAVGGNRFDGSGGKIADYLVRAGHLGNLAIVEIKTPQTVMLEARPYRGDVHALSKHIAGAITQVLDQRYQLHMSINDRKIASGTLDVFSFAVQALIIAGRDPEGQAERKSFELLRNGLKDVVIVTFDELLGKLRTLHEFLNSGAQP